jgi:hypothetical protein
MRSLMLLDLRAKVRFPVMSHAAETIILQIHISTCRDVEHPPVEPILKIRSFGLWRFEQRYTMHNQPVGSTSFVLTVRKRKPSMNDGLRAIKFAALAVLLSSAGAICQQSGAVRYTVNHAVNWRTGTPESTKSFAAIPDAKELVIDDDGHPSTYSYAYEDLKGDGTKQLIIQASGMTWCGSAGCLTIILDRRKGKWVPLLSETIGEALTVMNERANGYACVRADFGDGVTMNPHTFLLKAPDAQANSSLRSPLPANSQIQVPTSFTINHAVKFYGETEGDKNIDLIKHLPVLAPYFNSLGHMMDRPEFVYAIEDLKGDGSKDLIFQVRNSTLCTQDGCVTWILEHRSNQTVEIFSAALGNEMFIMNEKVNGYFAIQALYQRQLGVLKPKVFTLSPDSLKTTDPFTWGDISGELTIARGDSAIPLVSTTVTATNVQTGEVVHAASGKDGWYHFHNLIPDLYEITLQLSGRDPDKRAYWLNGSRAGQLIDFDE